MAAALTLPYPFDIEALTAAHDRRSFSCGVEALDQYLKRYARQHADTNVSRTFVAVNSPVVWGYYSLAMSGIRRDNLPERHAKRFPNFPLPVARLARLAVDLKVQRQGLGELLLADALRRCLEISESIGMIGVLVDVKDERASDWYLRYEFERLPDAPLTLWLPTAAIARL